MIKPITIFTLATAVLATGCAPQHSQTAANTHVSASMIAASNQTPADKAEAYAKAGETLLTAQGFSQAHELGELALQQDPENLRALFIRAISTPLVLQKGIAARLRGVAQRDPRMLRDYDHSLRRESRNTDQPEVFKYALAGTADIVDERGVQQHFDELVKAFDDLRLFAKNHKDQTLTVKANKYLVNDLMHRYTGGCEIKTTAALEYELICPPASTRYEVTMNRADFEALQDMATFMEIYVGDFNSYDVTGFFDQLRAHYKQRQDANQITDALMHDGRFGALRSSQTLTKTRGWMLDVVESVRWMMANQSSICPKGTSDPHNRVGMWINSGLCYPPILGSYVDIEVALINGGSEQRDYSNSEDGSYTSTDVPFALLNHPLTNLRQLGPLQFDQCNGLISVGDQTLGGMTPRGDANMVLKYQQPKCVTP